MARELITCCGICEVLLSGIAWRRIESPPSEFVLNLSFRVPLNTHNMSGIRPEDHVYFFFGPLIAILLSALRHILPPLDIVTPAKSVSKLCLRVV